MTSMRVQFINMYFPSTVPIGSFLMEIKRLFRGSQRRFLFSDVFALSREQGMLIQLRNAQTENVDNSLYFLHPKYPLILMSTLYNVLRILRARSHFTHRDHSMVGLLMLPLSSFVACFYVPCDFSCLPRFLR
jgi:hypothetical protein